MGPSYKKYYSLLGLAGILGLIILAIIYFKERTAISDMAYMLVNHLVERKPSWWFVRIGAVIPQFFTLAGIYAHCSLKTAMILHSISTLLLYVILYFFASLFSRSRLLFLTMPLVLLLLTNDVFFWPISEVQQGLIWLCLYAVLLYEGRWQNMKPIARWTIHFVFILWIQFLHPLLFFPIAFLIIYYYGSLSGLRSRAFMIHFGICIAAFVIRRLVALREVYENGRMNIGSVIRHNLPHLFSLDSVHVFWHKLASAYLVYILLFIGSVVWLMSRRMYLRAGIIGFLSFGYWILVMIDAPEDSRFYSENMLLPLAFMISLPIVADVIPAMRLSYGVLLVLTVICVRLGFICHIHQDYTDRLAMYDPYFTYVREHQLNGVLVAEKTVDAKKAIVTWSSGYESVLLSSLVSPDSCRVVQVFPDPHQFDWGYYSDTILITYYNQWNKCQLPREYFRLRERHYGVITEPL